MYINESGLFRKLHQAGWISRLDTYYNKKDNLLVVDMDMTELGFNDKSLLVESVFKFITATLQSETDRIAYDPDFYRVLMDRERLRAYINRGPIKAIQQVTSLAKRLYQMANELSETELFAEENALKRFDASIIRQTANLLQIERCIIRVTAIEYYQSGSDWPEEPRFGSRYISEQITDDFLEEDEIAAIVPDEEMSKLGIIEKNPMDDLAPYLERPEIKVTFIFFLRLLIQPLTF